MMAGIKSRGEFVRPRLRWRDSAAALAVVLAQTLHMVFGGAKLSDSVAWYNGLDRLYRASRLMSTEKAGAQRAPVFRNALDVCKDDGLKARPVRAQELCCALLSGRGEASGEALACELIRVYQTMKPAQRVAFFEMLARDFAPDPRRVSQAAKDYFEKPCHETFFKLWSTVEPPRQELFRRINVAPGGTQALIDLRADLINLLSQRPHLAEVDFDLKHLFASWFNRGFLRLERIDWRTPAEILEKLIRYEAVHEINGWTDLRRRLAEDRRCFAFFHPALPGEPLIFVEVALTRGVARTLQPLLDPEAPILPSEQADTAIFYSISNCLAGLRGISFGSFLIKQVMAELKAELRGVRHYLTLSPLPGFAAALRERADPHGFTHRRLLRLLSDYASQIRHRTGMRNVVEGFDRLLADPLANKRVLAAPLARLALAYLTQVKRDGQIADPVASFHLANGARLERINPFANTKLYGLQSSFGLMVNYRYVSSELEQNHEAFVTEGVIALSPWLEREYRKIAMMWGGDENLSSLARVKL